MCSDQPLRLITPQWPAPARVAAAVTSRTGGVSIGPWQSLNLGDHVGDDATAVAVNRQRLQQQLALPTIGWLQQSHGQRVVTPTATDRCADAAVTRDVLQPCAILSADCLPVLLCDRSGTVVAAAHAGWRGLATGILEQSVAAMGVAPTALLAWLGPAISQRHFEVGDQVRHTFMATDRAAASAFRSSRPGHWFADLYQLAQQRLSAVGVTAIYGGGECTFGQPDRYFSYRRDGTTGRMASLIWLRP